MFETLDRISVAWAVIVLVCLGALTLMYPLKVLLFLSGLIVLTIGTIFLITSPIFIVNGLKILFARITKK